MTFRSAFARQALSRASSGDVGVVAQAERRSAAPTRRPSRDTPGMLRRAAGWGQRAGHLGLTLWKVAPAQCGLNARNSAIAVARRPGSRHTARSSATVSSHAPPCNQRGVGPSRRASTVTLPAAAIRRRAPARSLACPRSYLMTVFRVTPIRAANAAWERPRLDADQRDPVWEPDVALGFRRWWPSHGPPLTPTAGDPRRPGASTRRARAYSSSSTTLYTPTTMIS